MKCAEFSPKISLLTGEKDSILREIPNFIKNEGALESSGHINYTKFI